MKVVGIGDGEAGCNRCKVGQCIFVKHKRTFAASIRMARGAGKVE